jgi:hypothetical protein
MTCEEQHRAFEQLLEGTGPFAGISARLFDDKFVPFEFCDAPLCVLNALNWQSGLRDRKTA